MGMFSSSRRDGYYVSYGPRPRYVYTRQPDVVYTNAQGRVATSVRQTCSSCGKFRSARWEAAHPLLPGTVATSSICGKCRRNHTSSEEKESRRCRKHHHHHHPRHCTDSADDSYHYCNDRRSPRRYHSDSRDCPGHRASSRDNIRIVIANQPGERGRRQSTRSGSIESARFIRRTEVVELPERIRSRSKTRSSSRAYYLEDGTAHYVEDLARPSYRAKPRSLSRTTYVEEIEPARYRTPRRSSSRVQFVDEIEDPVIVSKPRRLSRRRAVYFDGAADSSTFEQEVRGRSQSPSKSSHRLLRSSEDSSGGTQLIEEAAVPHSRQSSQARERQGGPELGEETVTSHRRLSSESTATDANTLFVRQQRYLDDTAFTDLVHPLNCQPSEPDSYEVESDYDKTPHPAFRSMSADQLGEHTGAPKGHKGTYSKTKSSEYHQGSSAPKGETAESHSQHVHHEPGTPQNKRRRKSSDDSTGDDRAPITPMSYRHVQARAPSPPSPQHDYLSEMLQSSHITPPNELSDRKYGYGRPSQHMLHCTSRSESPIYRPPFCRDTASGGTEHGSASYKYPQAEYENAATSYAYVPAEEQNESYASYGDEQEQWVPQSADTREYDWMT